MRAQRHHFVLAAVVGLAVAALWPLLIQLPPRVIEAFAPPSPGGSSDIPDHRPRRHWTPPLGLVSAWVNGRPTERVSVPGHLVVIALFSDTNPLSAEFLRRVEAWHEAYARYDVRVVGVHHPQFTFVADTTVLARFARRLGLTFPIASDPAQKIRIEDNWTAAAPPSGVAFATSTPPSEPGIPLVVIVNTRDSMVGRGWGEDPQSLDRAEGVIRQELRRMRPDVGFPAEIHAPSSDPNAYFGLLAIYLGVRRPEGALIPLRGPLERVKPGTPQTFVAPFRFDQGGQVLTPYPVGRWTLAAEGLIAARGSAADFLAIRYDPGKWGLRRVGVVASPPRSGSAKLWVLRDDAWLSADALGEDARLDARGASYVDVSEPRLYMVAKGLGSHVIKLSPESPGLTIHELTFDSLPAELDRP